MEPIEIFVAKENKRMVFESVSSLMTWAKDEQNFWHWASPSLSYEKYNIYFNRIISLGNNYDRQVSETEKSNTSNEIIQAAKSFYSDNSITKDSATAKFLEKLKIKNIHSAIGAFDYFHNKNYKEINESVFHKTVGVTEAILFERNLIEGSLHFESLEKNQDDFQKSTHEIFTKTQTLVDEVTNIYEQTKKKSLSISLQQKKAIEITKEELEEFTKEFKEKINKIELFYKEGLRLKSPIQYWNNQKIIHEAKAKKALTAFFWAIPIFVVLAIGFVTCIFKFFEFLQYEKYFLVALFIAFGTWVIKTIYKQYLNHENFGYTANEKEVMTNVYLSLLEDGKGMNDQERTIVLSAVFKSSSEIVLKDDGGANTPLEVILKNFSTKS